MQFTFSQYLKEQNQKLARLNEGPAKEDSYLDISIPLEKKVMKTEEDMKKFLDEEITIVEKYDGRKLTIIRSKNPYVKGDIDNNWVVAYKGMIIYADEFLSADKSKVKDTIGLRWFSLVWDKLRDNDNAAKNIPENTEMFCEYILRAETLSREYSNFGNIYLVGYAKTTYQDNGGKLQTSPELPMIMEGDTFEQYRDALQLNSFRPYFKGKLNDYKSSEIILPKLKEELNNAKIDLMSPERKYKTIKDIILGIESELGGKSEGVVIRRADGSRFKFVQEDTYSKEHRDSIKAKYRYEDKELTDAFWKEVNSFIDTFWEELTDYKKSVKQNLMNLSDYIYNLKDIPIKHPKRSEEIIKDDIYETAKRRMMALHPDFSAGFFIGRMQPPQRLHCQIIQQVIDENKHAVVGVVNTGKPREDSPFSYETVKKCLNAVFGNKVAVFKVGNGYLPRVFESIPYNISKVYAGSDRREGYEKQFEDNPMVEIVNIERLEPVSGTQVRKALLDNDEAEFKKLTNPKMHKLFKELREEILEVYKKLKIAK